MGQRKPAFSKLLAVASRLPAKVPPGPVDPDGSLFGALTAAAARDPQLRWAADHEPIGVRLTDGSVSLAELSAAAQRIAAALHRSGLQPGDWCVVWVDDPFDVVLAITALTGLGVVPVALSPKLDPQLAAQALATVPHPLAFLTARHRHDDLAAHGVRTGGGPLLAWESVVAGDAGTDAVGTDAGAGAVPPVTGVRRDPGEPYLVTHTSGTTGVPKLAIHTVRSFFEQADLQCKVMRVLRLRGHLAAAISPVHVRTLSGVLAAMRSGLPLVLCKAEDVGSVQRMLLRWRPVYLETHPNSYVLWEQLAPTGAMASVRLFVGTFDAVHPRTIQAMLAGSQQKRPIFVEIYAQSEVGPISNRLWIGGGRRSEQPLPAEEFGHGVGWPVPGYSQARVVDEHGATVPDGQPGRIVARSRGRFAGYLNFPELFRQNLSSDGWWDTGDYGAIGPDRQLHLLDRQVEKLAGARSAVGLEDILLQRLPQLTEVVVMEVAGSLLPVVSTRDDVPVDPAEWARATADLPPLPPPTQLRWDDIPRTATGKVRRKVLHSQVVRS